MRGLGPDASLFFPVVVVEAEEDEPALYGASVAGFENRMVAMGHSEDEATENAIGLFQGMVDHALKQKKPLSDVLGDVFFKHLPYPVTEAKTVFKLWKEIEDEETEDGSEDSWTQLPTSPQFISLAGMSA